MTISPAFLDELRARIPLSDIVGRRMKLQRAGREYKAPCPFHAEKTPSFYINDQKAFFHCFGCGAHGDAVGFVMRHDGLSFPEAVEQLAALAGMAMPRPEPGEQQTYDRHKRLADLLENATKFFESQLRSAAGRDALAYLRGRGLDDQAIAEFRLGYAPAPSDALGAALIGQGHAEAELEEVGLLRRPDDGRAPYAFFRNRVMFPVSDSRGRIIAFGGRLLEGDGPKYVNSPEHALFHKGNVLYGLARARAAIAKGERPIVVEGYMDVIAMQRAGFGGAVAALGTALGEGQLALLWKAQAEKAALEAPPILCFDGDTAGRRAAERAIERILPLLSPARTVSVAFLPQGEDPDSLSRKGGAGAVQQVLDSALPLIDAVWQFAIEGRMLTTPEQRAGFWAHLDAQTRAIVDRQVQQLYRGELRQRFDAMFQPARAQNIRRAGGGAFVKGADFKATGRNPLTPPGPLPSRAPTAAALEGRILLAMMINHPFLFEEGGESFAEIDLPVVWLPLRDAVFAILAAEPLDAQALGVHLNAHGHGALLDDVLGADTTDHAKFVRQDTPPEIVRAAWVDVWTRSHRRLIGLELASARSDPNRGDDQALRRISALAERSVETGGAAGYGEVDGQLPDRERAALERTVTRALGLSRQRNKGDETNAADHDL
jgi:DNA primase